MLLAFVSTVIPLKVHDQDFYSLLDLYVFQNGASSLMKEGSVFLVGATFVALYLQHEYIHTVMASSHCGLCASLVTALY
jgi:hypothetical protein